MSITRYVNPRMRAELLAGKGLPAYWAKNPRADYIAAICISAPPWVDAKEVRQFAVKAVEKTKTTGVKHVVDHIIPVNHPLVCGLTVPWNLRVIDWLLNARKSNKLHYAFQQEMFTDPEQLELL